MKKVLGEKGRDFEVGKRGNFDRYLRNSVVGLTK